MSDTARGAVIAGHCRQLKLPAVLREYPALARQAAGLCFLLPCAMSFSFQTATAALSLGAGLSLSHLSSFLSPPQLWSGCCHPVSHKYGIWSRQEPLQLLLRVC